MPRVTNSEHYRRHQFLQMLWREPGLDVFFSLIGTTAQWRLHDYYQPDKDLDEADFNRHRKAVDRDNPLLTHVVGKNFRTIESAFVVVSREFGVDQNQMCRAIAAATSRSGRRTAARSSSVHVSVIANSPDPRRVARVFLRLAEYLDANTNSFEKDSTK